MAAHLQDSSVNDGLRPSFFEVMGEPAAPATLSSRQGLVQRLTSVRRMSPEEAMGWCDAWEDHADRSGMRWALSPDGARYAAQAGSGIEVATLGGPPLHLTTDGGDSDPRWSPDGRWIAFWGMRVGVVGLYVVPGDGGQPALVGTDASSGGSDPWQPATNGGSRLAFVRDRAILTVKSDGSDPRELASRTTIAGAPRVPTTGDSTFQDRMVIGPDGPDRDIYRVSVGRTLGFTFENRTGDPWVVTLDEWDILAGDCRITAAGTIILAAYRPDAGSAPSAPATPPDFCLIPPHRSVSITIAESLRGPAEARVGRSGTDNAAAYPVIFDREGSE